MKIFTKRIVRLYAGYTRFLGAILLAAIFATSIAMSIETLNLRSTSNFAVLAGSTVTCVPPISMTGDVGLSPAAGSYIVGFDGSNVTGILYVVDASGPSGSVINPILLQAAKSDLTIAYGDAAGRTPVPTGPFLNPGGGNIGGLNLVAGLYKFTSDCGITGSNVTLTGSATDVWIFQIVSSLNVGNGIHVTLAGGAQAANIFWQVGSSATLGTYSVFKGTILADQSVSLGTGATMDGRALAFSAAVTMASGANVTKPVINNTTMPIFSVNPLQLGFGNVNNGLSKMDSVTVTNTGTADLIISSVTSSNLLYTVTPTIGTIQAGASRKFYVTFAPTSNGVQNGYITFNHNAANIKDSVKVSGTGVGNSLAPNFLANPLSLVFGNVNNGLTKRDSVTVTNTGTSDLIISSVTSSNLLFTATPTIGTISQGSTLKFYVTFAPTADGLQNGYIYFSHNAASSKDSVQLSGTGVSNSLAPNFLASPLSLDFGNVKNGLSKEDSVTVTNTGTADLIISSIITSNSKFTVTPLPVTITQGSTRKFYITFAPTADGLQTGYIYFIHNAVSGTDSIQVRGTGVSNDAPLFSVNLMSIDFGTVLIGSSKHESVIVKNLGTADLIITEITSSYVQYTFTPIIGTIAAGATLEFIITFAPTTENQLNGKIIFTYNGGMDSISVTGKGSIPNPVSEPVAINQNSLSDNYPNPFSSITSIQYNLENAEFVSLKVFNVLGDEVATLVNGSQESGTHTVLFSTEGNNLSLGSNVYFYRLVVGKFVTTRQMVFVK